MKFHFDDELLSNEAMHELACEAARTIMRLPSSKIQALSANTMRPESDGTN